MRHFNDIKVYWWWGFQVNFHPDTAGITSAKMRFWLTRFRHFFILRYSNTIQMCIFVYFVHIEVHQSCWFVFLTRRQFRCPEVTRQRLGLRHAAWRHRPSPIKARSFAVNTLVSDNPSTTTSKSVLQQMYSRKFSHFVLFENSLYSVFKGNFCLNV